MAEKDRIDFIIYGASGCTGYYCVKNLIKINLQKNKNYSFAVAGRNEEKIRQTLKDVGTDLKQDTSNIKIILANADSKKSLVNMTRQAKIVITVVGPYYIYGRPLVEACIETDTHYVDISGEPQFIETIQNDFFDQAREKGLYIISSCGFDSIPADLGSIYLKDQCQDAEIRYIEGYINYNIPQGYSINSGTFFSLLESLKHYKKLKSIRDTMFNKFFKKSLRVVIPKADKKIFLHKAPYSNSAYYPFWNLDASVVKRTQLFFYNEDESDKPLSFSEYIQFKYYIQAFAFVLTYISISLLYKFDFLLNLVKKYPKSVDWLTLGLFSSKGPSKKQIESSSFEFYLVGKGIKKNDSSSSVSKTLYIEGCEMGYDCTSLFLLNSAIVILEELAGQNKGNTGVVTPGYAFRHTNYVNKIRELGVEWKMINNE